MSDAPRDEIKKILTEHFTERLAKKVGQSIETKQCNEYVEPRAEELLRKFEENVLNRQIKEEFKKVKPSFISGIFQSVIGGILLFIVLGLIVLIGYGSRFNFWQAVELFSKEMNTKSTIEQRHPPDHPIE